LNVAEGRDGEKASTGHPRAEEDIPLEEPLSDSEREDIIQDLISTQRLAGIEVSYDEAAAALDAAYAEPLVKIDGI
jgi:hypothetical protein